jgi:hypothetical protein
VHLIRLASPWERRRHPHLHESPAADWERIQIPDLVHTRVDESTGPDGSVIYRRTFNRPTSLEDDTPVWLFIESWLGGIMGIELNGETLDFPDAIPVRISIDGPVALRTA